MVEAMSSRDAAFYSSFQRVRFDDDLPLSEQSIRRSCRQLYNSFYNQSIRRSKPAEIPGNYPSHPPAALGYLPPYKHEINPQMFLTPSPYTIQLTNDENFWKPSIENAYTLKKVRKCASEINLNGSLKASSTKSVANEDITRKEETPFYENGDVSRTGEINCYQNGNLRARCFRLPHEVMVAPRTPTRRRSSVCSSFADASFRQAVVTPTKEYCTRKDRMRRSSSSFNLHTASLGRDGNKWDSMLHKQMTVNGLPVDPSAPWVLKNSQRTSWDEMQCNFCNRHETRSTDGYILEGNKSSKGFGNDVTPQLIPKSPRSIGRREQREMFYANGGPLLHGITAFQLPPNDQRGPVYFPSKEKFKGFDSKSCYDPREMNSVHKSKLQGDPRETTEDLRPRSYSSASTTKEMNEKSTPRQMLPRTIGKFARPQCKSEVHQKQKMSAISVESKNGNFSGELTNGGSESSCCSSLPDEFLISPIPGHAGMKSNSNSARGTLESRECIVSKRKIVYKSDSAIHVSSKVMHKKSFLQKICAAARFMGQSLRQVFSQEQIKQQHTGLSEIMKGNVNRNNSLDSLYKQEPSCSSSDQESHVSGQLIQVHQDSSLLVELSRNPEEPFGFFLVKGRVRNRKGVFVSRMASSRIREDLSGLVELGDEIMKIDGIPVNSDEITKLTQMLSEQSTVLLTIMPYSYRKNVVYY